MLIVLPNFVAAEERFWKIQNVNASKNRAKEVETALEKCQSGLRPYFNFQPQKLTVHLYGTRNSFVKDLQDFSKRIL